MSKVSKSNVKALPGEKILRTTCHLCHGGCILLAHVKDGELQYMEGDPDGPHNRGSICEKALAVKQYLSSPYRLRYPLKRIGKRGEGKWQRISWDEAMKTIVDRLQETKDKYGSESIAYAWGTGRVIDMSFWKNFFNYVIETPNGIGIGHVCLTKTRSSLVGAALGQIKGPTSRAEFRDFENSKCIIGWGDTLIDSRNDRMALAGRRLMDAKRSGTKLIMIDPVFTLAAQKADIWLPIRPGTDHALAMCWLNIIINENLFDQEFVKGWTNAPFLVRGDTRKLLRASDVRQGGMASDFVIWNKRNSKPEIWNSRSVSFESADVEPALDGAYSLKLSNGSEVECKTVWEMIKEQVAEWTIEKTAKVTWLDKAKIREAALLYAKSKPASIEWGVAMSQCTRSTATNLSILHLKAITGNLDIKGGQPFWQVPGYKKSWAKGIADPKKEAKRITGGYCFSAAASFSFDPSAHQPAVWKAMVTGEPYPIKALFGTHSNPLATHEWPQGNVMKALEKVDFIVWTDITMTPSNEFADIILPVCTPFERDWVSDTYEVGVFAGQKIVEPMWESRSDFYIYKELCHRMGRPEIWPWETEEAFCDECLKDMGITFRQLTDTCFRPAADIWKKYEKGILRPDKKPGFDTPSGKAELWVSFFEGTNVDPLPPFKFPVQCYEKTPDIAKEYPLILITGSRELNYPFFHSQYHYVPWLRQIQRYPIILIHPETASKLNISNGDWAWVETRMGKSRFKAEVTQRIHPKVVSVSHAWWYPELPGPYHGIFESNANMLIDPFTENDPATGTTELRGLLCKVYCADGPPDGVVDEQLTDRKKERRKK